MSGFDGWVNSVSPESVGGELMDAITQLTGELCTLKKGRAVALAIVRSVSTYYPETRLTDEEAMRVGRSLDFLTQVSPNDRLERNRQQLLSELIAGCT